MIRHWTVDKSHKTDPIWYTYVFSFAIALFGLTGPADNYTRPKGMIRH